jgi:hypothetical protein
LHPIIHLTNFHFKFIRLHGTLKMIFLSIDIKPIADELFNP